MIGVYEKDTGWFEDSFSRQIISMDYTIWIKQIHKFIHYKHMSVGKGNQLWVQKIPTHSCSIDQALSTLLCRPFLRTLWPARHLWECSSTSPAPDEQQACCKLWIPTAQGSFFPSSTTTAQTEIQLTLTVSSPWDLGDVGNWYKPNEACAVCQVLNNKVFGLWLRIRRPSAGI